MMEIYNTDVIKWPMCEITSNDWPAVEIYDYYSHKNSSNSTLKQTGVKWQDHFIAGNPDKVKQKLYYNIADSLGLQDCQVLIQTQKPGQQMTVHLDAGSRKTYAHLSDHDHKTKLKRAFIFLADWQEGHVIQMDSVNFSGWKMGQVLGFDWTKVRHGTSNFGNHDRPMLCVTGTDTEKWHQLWNASTVTQIDI